jgi:hypothetical protein
MESFFEELTEGNVYIYSVRQCTSTHSIQFNTGSMDCFFMNGKWTIRHNIPRSGWDFIPAET